MRQLLLDASLIPLLIVARRCIGQEIQQLCRIPAYNDISHMIWILVYTWTEPTPWSITILICTRSRSGFVASVYHFRDPHQPVLTFVDLPKHSEPGWEYASYRLEHSCSVRHPLLAGPSCEGPYQAVCHHSCWLSTPRGPKLDIGGSSLVSVSGLLTNT